MASATAAAAEADAGGEAVAVDWSGNARSSRALVAARASGGRLLEIVTGLRRDEMVDWIVARDTTPLAVGLDFAFSLPRWFLTERCLPDASALWRLVSDEGEAWLADCQPPFWGRPGKRRPSGPAQFRRTEEEVSPVAGTRPKPAFQIGGAGSVGTGSLRGMPFLPRLAGAGFRIWPFDPGGERTVVEIWPRALTGPVVKRDLSARARRLGAELSGPTDPALVAAATASEDAFDAAVASLVISRHLSAFVRLPSARDEVARVEGEIWLPPTAVRQE